MKPSINLMRAASELTLLCEKIDAGADLDAELCALFEEKKTSLQEAIDHRQAVMAEIKNKIQMAKAYKKEIHNFQKKLENIAKRIRQRTIFLLKSQPDLPYRNSLGEKLTLYRRKETLKLHPSLERLETYGKFKLLSPDIIRDFHIDPKHVKEVSFLTLDLDQALADLNAGDTLFWANLERSECLRGL